MVWGFLSIIQSNTEDDLKFFFKKNTIKIILSKNLFLIITQA